jgi:hypothetical protein
MSSSILISDDLVWVGDESLFEGSGIAIEFSLSPSN